MLTGSRTCTHSAPPRSIFSQPPSSDIHREGSLVFDLPRADDCLKQVGRTIVKAYADWLVRTATLALLGLASGTGHPARAQCDADTYAKAKAESAFVLYVVGPTAPREAMSAIFEERYCEIRVT